MNIRFEDLIYLLPAILIALTLHELAHGYVSYRLGDPTPKQEGRLSLNPFRHLDPFGTLSLLIFGFGWAKPVMVNPGYYKNPRTGMMYTALAGPLINFVIAFFCLLFYVIITFFNVNLGNFDITLYIIKLLAITAQINVGLGVFNLIPIPPLDGSKIFLSMLPQEQYYKIVKYENVLSFGLIALLFLGILDGPLYVLRSEILSGLLNIVTLILGIS